MPTQTATTPLIAVLGADDIANTFDALGVLAQAIDDLEKQRAAARTALAQSVAKGLAAEPPDVGGVVAQYQTYETNDQVVASKIEVCEKKLPPIIKEHQEYLKETQWDAVVAYLEAKLGRLEAGMASEEGKEALLKREISETKKLLRELHTEAAKSKKE